MRASAPSSKPSPAAATQAVAASSSASNPSDQQPLAPPATVSERSQQRYDESRPLDAARRKLGFSALSPDQQATWITAQWCASPCSPLNSTSTAGPRARLPPKAQRELWRHVNEACLPVRALRKHHIPNKTAPRAAWGTDRNGRDVGSYTLEQFDERTTKRIALTALQVASRAFCENRERARRGALSASGEKVILTDTEADEEKNRRREMAALKKELYGAGAPGAGLGFGFGSGPGSLTLDPEWDDVVPLPQNEPEGALAAITYPAEYAEGEFYVLGS